MAGLQYLLPPLLPLEGEGREVAPYRDLPQVEDPRVRLVKEHQGKSDTRAGGQEKEKEK